MIIINRNKNIEQYKIPPMPIFSNKRTAVAWKRVQRMNAALINIESVDVQVKDIKQMIYTQSSNLVSLYAKLNLNDLYNDYYINISKNEKRNKFLIFDILNANWLLKLEDIESKSIEELECDRQSIQNKITDLKGKKDSFSRYYIGNNIRLLEYKLACLEDYIDKKEIGHQENPVLVRRMSQYVKIF